MVFECTFPHGGTEFVHPCIHHGLVQRGMRKSPGHHGWLSMLRDDKTPALGPEILFPPLNWLVRIELGVFSYILVGAREELVVDAHVGNLSDTILSWYPGMP